MSRITTQGRDWTTTSNARANTERRTDRMALSRSDRRDAKLCMAIAFVLPFIVAGLSTLRWP